MAQPIIRFGRRFALDGDRLALVLADQVAGFTVSRDQGQQGTAWLPSSEHGALPSSPLLTDAPEEKIDAMIEAKRELVGSVIGSGEAWITKLSNAELKELFALREDALGE